MFKIFALFCLAAVAVATKDDKEKNTEVDAAVLNENSDDKDTNAGIDTLDPVFNSTISANSTDSGNSTIVKPSDDGNASASLALSLAAVFVLGAAY